MPDVYDLIIIGGGPAGITAGIYAIRQKLKTLLITKTFGGQVARKAVDIENYPGFDKISGMELIQKFEKHLAGFDVDIEKDLVVSVKKDNNFFLVLTENKQKFQAKTIIVASGANPRFLEVPGEKKFIGKGVSYCSACDGPIFSNKTVAVVGGGNAGFETVIALSKWVKKIYILEHASKISADKENQEIVKKTGKVEIITNVAIKQIKGEQFVNSIVYQNRRDGVSSLKENILKVEGVFVEIGSIPATDFLNTRAKRSGEKSFSSLSKDLVDLNEKGEIKIDLKTYMIKTAGIFAAGDVTEIKEKQIVIAAGQGAFAALSVSQYIQNQ